MQVFASPNTDILLGGGILWEINWIIKELGGINVDMTSKGSKRR